MHSLPRTASLLTLVASVALTSIVPEPLLAQQQPPRRQPAPAPRSVAPDSGRARALGSDTTRNRRAANQDSASTGAQGSDSTGGEGGRGGGPYAGIRLRSIGPAMISGRISDIAVHPRDKKIWFIGVAAGG